MRRLYWQIIIRCAPSLRIARKLEIRIVSDARPAPSPLGDVANRIVGYLGTRFRELSGVERRCLFFVTISS